MTRSRPRSLSVAGDEDEGRSKSPPTGGAAAMRIIVPLQGVVQGRGGLVLGSVIPCVLFYCLQLYLKRHRPSLPPTPTPSASSVDLPRALARTSSAAPAPVSARAAAVAKVDESPMSSGRDQFVHDPYDRAANPDGVIELGAAENQLSSDVVRDWLARHVKDLLLDGVHGLSISGLAAYQPFDGTMDLKMVWIHDADGVEQKSREVLAAKDHEGRSINSSGLASFLTAITPAEPHLILPHAAISDIYILLISLNATNHHRCRSRQFLYEPVWHPIAPHLSLPPSPQ